MQCSAVRHDVSQVRILACGRRESYPHSATTCYNFTLLSWLHALSLSFQLSLLLPSPALTLASPLFSSLRHSSLSLAAPLVLITIYQSICLSVCLFVYLSVRELIPYRSVVYRITHLDLSIRPAIHSTIHPSIYLCTNSSFLFPFIYLSIQPCILTHKHAWHLI